MFFLCFISVYSIYPQITWGVKTEAGYNFASGSGIVDSSDLLIGLDGELAYLYERDNKQASLTLRARPEIYGLNKELVSAKLRARSNFYRDEGNFGWGIILTGQRNIFDKKDFNLIYDIVILNAEASCFFIESVPFTLNLGYASQTTEHQLEQSLDLFFFETNFFNQIDFLRIGYGMYIEKFNLSYEKNRQSEFRNSNNGWRIGPQISLNYLKDWIFSAEYRFLFHNSQVTERPSYDQWIRLLAGKIFLDDFSFFILADFYLQDYKIKSDSTDILPVLYSPIDQENNLYLKVSYDISDIFSVYIRSGYFKENLFLNNLSFSGWNILLGLEISN
jgi:hypothetical protein